MCKLQCVKPILLCVVLALWNVSRCVFTFCKELECHQEKFLTALVLGSVLISPLVQKDPVQKDTVTRSAIPINLKQTKHMQEQLCNLYSSGTPNQPNSGSTMAYTGSRKERANQQKGNSLTISKYREVVSDSRIPWITSSERQRDDWVEVSWYVNPIIFFPRHLLFFTVRDQCPVQQFLNSWSTYHRKIKWIMSVSDQLKKFN